MPTRFVANKAGFNNVLRSPNGMVGGYLKSRGQQLTSLAQRQVGVRTHALKRSIKYLITNSSNGELLVRVGSDNKIARIHHDGTKPHIIKPRYKKALRFQQHGKIVFASVVRHPGTKPNRFLTDNLPKVID